MTKEVVPLTKKGTITDLLDKARMIPDEAYTRMGCSYCEWRRIKGKCPYTSESSGVFKPAQDNICERRVMHMISLTPFYEEKPSLDEWMLDFNKAIGQIKVLEELNDEAMIKQLLDETTKRSDLDLVTQASLIDSLQSRLRHQKSFGLYWWKEFTKLVDAKLGRETVKKIQLQDSISPSQFQNMIKSIDEDNIIDAEFESITDLGGKDEQS